MRIRNYSRTLVITKCLGPVNSFVISDIRYKRIIINAFSALGENLHFVISGYFVISDLVITGVYCIIKQTCCNTFLSGLSVHTILLFL